MPTIEVRHSTRFRYNAPVVFGPHELRLRPRESANVRLLAFNLETRPNGDVSWTEDVYGNMVATVRFAEPACSLLIESVAKVDLFAQAWPVFPIKAEAIQFPFPYPLAERGELGVLLEPAYASDAADLRTWAERFVLGRPTDTLSLLADLNAGVGGAATYEAREDEGTLTPLQTLKRGRGSCRDLAVLFVEATRCLGFAARIVSGYLHDPDRALLGSADAGSTHAWAEVYVPGAGWIVYDSTNRRTGGFNLIPVAVAATIERATPVAGSFTAAPAALIEMSVAVSVR